MRSKKLLSRLDFLKLSGLMLGSLGAGWLDRAAEPWPPEEFSSSAVFKGRVTTRKIHIYPIPDFKSKRLGQVRRDTLLNLHEVVDSPYGPSYNPRWYRLDKGYVHSAYIQRLDGVIYNLPVFRLPGSGQLGEITVPFVQSIRKTPWGDWQPLYRLYYQSVFWVTSLVEGPDGKTWYGLTDDLLNVVYCVPAWSVRLITPDELAPISPHIPDEEKRIEVSLFDQTLTAYESGRIVLYTKVSTGLPGHLIDDGEDQNADDYIDPETPEGKFYVQVKQPSRHMGDGRLTADPEAYELPGVPWVCYFYKTGVAFHGTYWHDNFGRKMSHGCVNMRSDEAKWLYRWSRPSANEKDWNVKGLGTQVFVS